MFARLIRLNSFCLIPKYKIPYKTLQLHLNFTEKSSGPIGTE